jgi:hypothetical protein
MNTRTIQTFWRATLVAACMFVPTLAAAQDTIQDTIRDTIRRDTTIRDTMRDTVRDTLRDTMPRTEAPWPQNDSMRQAQQRTEDSLREAREQAQQPQDERRMDQQAQANVGERSDRTDRMASRVKIMALQQELRDRGCRPGRVTGTLNSQTRRAMDCARDRGIATGETVDAMLTSLDIEFEEIIDPMRPEETVTTTNEPPRAPER